MKSFDNANTATTSYHSCVKSCKIRLRDWSDMKAAYALEVFTKSPTPHAINQSPDNVLS